jgi:hypothetical protein
MNAVEDSVWSATNINRCVLASTRLPLASLDKDSNNSTYTLSLMPVII